MEAETRSKGKCFDPPCNVHNLYMTLLKINKLDPSFIMFHNIHFTYF